MKKSLMILAFPLMALFSSCHKENIEHFYISTFSPTSGAPGTTITIAGSNFSNVNSNNVVKINGTTASVVSANVTTPTAAFILTVTVPQNATSGAITITVNGRTATSPSLFTVTN